MSVGPPNLFSVGCYARDEAWRIPPTKHPVHEVVTVTAGTAHVRTPDEECVAGPGDVLFFQAGVSHEEWGNGEAPLRNFHVAFTWSGDMSEWPLKLRDTLGRVQLLSAWMYAEPGPAARGARQGFLVALVGEIERLCGRPEDPLVSLTRRFVGRHMANPIDLATLAGEANLSKYHFVRKYKRLTGRTPMADVRNMRLEAARDLILTTALPLKAIAARVGLADETALCRLYRRRHNMTPGQLRRKR